MKTKSVKFSLLLDFYGQLLTERQRELVDLYYNDDLSLAEISELTGITRQGARDAIKNAENILLTYEEKLGMYSVFTERTRLMGTIEERVRSLRQRYDIPADDPDICAINEAAGAIAGDTED